MWSGPRHGPDRCADPKPTTTAISLRLPFTLPERRTLATGPCCCPYQSPIRLRLVDKVETGTSFGG